MTMRQVATWVGQPTAEFSTECAPFFRSGDAVNFCSERFRRLDCSGPNGASSIKRVFDPQQETAASLCKTRVLVVEDEMIVAMEIESILVKLGCEVIGVAMSGEEALSSAEKQPPDLALMDLRLKGAMDGIEAAREIIARFGARVVFVTAHSDPSTLSKFREIGAAGYLRKPFTPQGLAAIIHQALTDSGSQYDH